FLWGLFYLVAAGWGLASENSQSLLSPGIIIAALLSAVLGLLPLWWGWHRLTRKASVVLADDRMQWVEGKCIVWEASYEDIAQVALLSRPRGVGIQLRLPKGTDPSRPQLWWSWEQRWRRCWKRHGFDLALPAFCSSEPAERVLEAILTCLHRYRRMKE